MLLITLIVVTPCGTTLSWECVVLNRTGLLWTFRSSILCPSSGDWVGLEGFHGGTTIITVIVVTPEDEQSMFWNESKLVLFRTTHSQERVVPHGVTAINVIIVLPPYKLQSESESCNLLKTDRVCCSETLRVNRCYSLPHILKKESYHMVSSQLMLIIVLPPWKPSNPI